MLGTKLAFIVCSKGGRSLLEKHPDEEVGILVVVPSRLGKIF